MIKRETKSDLRENLYIGVGGNASFGDISSGDTRVLSVQIVNFRINNYEKIVNLHVGLQYTYYIASYEASNTDYTTSYTTERSNIDRFYLITANQLSLPVTLKFHLLRVDNHSLVFSSLYFSAKGLINYNINGRCFGVRQSNIVNPVNYSGIAAIGLGGKSWDLEAFYRKDFTPLFNRKRIYKFDNGDERIDYDALDKAMENKMNGGISFIYYFKLFK
jgi:hypothetical protein